MRSTVLENSSNKPNKQPVTNSISNGEVPTVFSPEEVFQDTNSPPSLPSLPSRALPVCYHLTLYITSVTTDNVHTCILSVN